jgi:PIN domain nuclease of toxin-antitoxin system
MIEKALLLDTCAFIYIAAELKLPTEVQLALKEAAMVDSLFVSPITAWELGKLATRGRLQFTTEPTKLFNQFVSRPGIRLCELTPEILINSSFLPGLEHKDPMDQILIATARSLNIPLVTNDRKILTYGREGHVKTLSC